ncbi:MAG: CoA transferase [Actinomycetota bacterium]
MSRRAPSGSDARSSTKGSVSSGPRSDGERSRRTIRSPYPPAATGSLDRSPADRWLELEPPWRPFADDVDRWAEVWWTSGARWLAGDRGRVPNRLIAELGGVVDHLRTRGARSLEGDPSEVALRVVTARAHAMRLGPAMGDRSCGGATRILRADDGILGVTLSRPDDLASVPAWLDVDPPEGSASDVSTWELVERVVAARPVDELLERGVLLGLPVARLGETPMPDVGPVRALRTGDAPPRSLDGLVVVNLASLWAGPLAARLLGDLGASVITVESIERPDGARRADAFFRSLHPGGEFVELEFRSPTGRRALADLLATADVVIEGSRPRALRQLGVDAESVLADDRGHADGPRVWLSITGHGRIGVAADRVGFGDDAAVAGGLVGHDGRGPHFVGDAIADPTTGLIAAATVVDLLERGGRWLVDAALARSAAWCAEPSHSGSDVREARFDRSPPRPTGWCMDDTSRHDVSSGRDTDRVLAERAIRSPAVGDGGRHPD